MKQCEGSGEWNGSKTHSVTFYIVPTSQHWYLTVAVTKLRTILGLDWK